MQRMAGREHVSDAADCHNPVPVLAKLASQVTDVDIDRAVAVHGDGARRRIDAQSPGAAPLTVVLNWTAAFSR
jgi:hypothetical protein